jgi:hypothetical protein
MSRIDDLIGSKTFQGKNGNILLDGIPTDVFELRNMETVSEDIINVVNLITLKSSTQPVGSFKYKVFKYPGDVDIFELITGCCTVRGFSMSLANRITNLARRLEINRNIFFGDFKAGYDSRYQLDIGEIQINNQNNEPYIKGYNQSKVHQQIKELYKKKLITKGDQKGLIQLAISEPISVGDHETLHEALRNYYVLRWSQDELINGYKILPRKIKITLADAISHGTVVKIDVWAPIANRYIEVTNFFSFILESEDGQTKEFITKELGNYKVNIFKDVIKYGAPEHRNSLKVAKRLWLISTLNKNRTLAESLAPLFISPASAISQVISESEVVRLILEKVSNPPVKVLMSQILGFEKRLKDNMPRAQEKIVDDHIDRIYNSYKQNNWNTEKNKQYVIKELFKLEERLKPLIEHYSFVYLRKYKLNPTNPEKNIPAGKELYKLLS